LLAYPDQENLFTNKKNSRNRPVKNARGATSLTWNFFNYLDVFIWIFTEDIGQHMRGEMVLEGIKNQQCLLNSQITKLQAIKG
jgi:hypothetical protein